MISLVDEASFRISIRVRIFGIFSKWVELMGAEAEHGPEVPIEFKTLDEAKNFIDLISE